MRQRPSKSPYAGSSPVGDITKIYHRFTYFSCKIMYNVYRKTKGKKQWITSETYICIANASSLAHIWNRAKGYLLCMGYKWKTRWDKAACALCAGGYFYRIILEKSRVAMEIPQKYLLFVCVVESEDTVASNTTPKGWGFKSLHKHAHVAELDYMTIELLMFNCMRCAKDAVWVKSGAGSSPAVCMQDWWNWKT